MARCAFPTSLLFSFGLIVLVCLPRSVMAEWSAIAESKASYTDNVTNFSAARRLKFSEDPSQPIGLPSQLSDVIWDPSLEVLRASSSTLGPNELSIKAHGFIYTNNPIFNHGGYRLQFKQGLSPDTSLLFRYRNVPNQFLGPDIECRTGNHLIQEFARHRFQHVKQRDLHVASVTQHPGGVPRVIDGDQHTRDDGASTRNRRRKECGIIRHQTSEGERWNSATTGNTSPAKSQ